VKATLLIFFLVTGIPAVALLLVLPVPIPNSLLQHLIVSGTVRLSTPAISSFTKPARAGLDSSPQSSSRKS
jgi:hypothetical protein